MPTGRRSSPARRLWFGVLLVGLATPAAAGDGVVVAADPAAAEAGASILQAGGNAIDAAVATAFALAVTYPQAGNLGGGGFLLARDARGGGWLIDFRERAPASATPDMFLDESGEPVTDRSRRGPDSVGVPGSVAGLLLALRRFGTLPREQVLEPAIRLAADGFSVPPGLAADLARYHERLVVDPYTARTFTRDGRPYAAGETLVQSDLARTLERIARLGEDGFYRGPSAERLPPWIGC